MSLKFSHQLPTPALFDSIHQLAEVLGEKSGAMPPFVETDVKAVSKGHGTAGRSNRQQHIPNRMKPACSMNRMPAAMPLNRIRSSF